MSTINQEQIAEEISYHKWEREMKNRILSMTDPVKKQELWNRYFPLFTLDDKWLSEAGDANIF